MVIKDSIKDKVIDAIIEISNTGNVGDGKIFVSTVNDAVRVRTKERGETAL
jgi:nitrogen regulatory protein PII